MKTTYSAFVEQVLMPRFLDNDNDKIPVTLSEANEYKSWLAPAHITDPLTFKGKQLQIVN